MIDLWYLNIKNIGPEEMSYSFKSLSTDMINEINRFRNHSDRQLKLYGKLMVKKYFEDKNLQFNWSEFRVSPLGKPYYKDGLKFNISHSGDFVIVAFSRQEIGADIERITDFDISSALDYLHPDEAEHIQHASNKEYTFFKVWTRKEAYLKAIGKGIIDGLDTQNCLKDELTYKEQWYLHDLSVIPDYRIALCTPIPDCQIAARELFSNEFKIQ